MSLPATAPLYESTLPAPAEFTLALVDNRISARLALITGASGGIGRACCRELAAEGCHIALTYSSNEKAAVDLAHELRCSYPNLEISVHHADLSAPDFLSPLLASLKTFHDMPVSIFVANAGRGVRVRHIEDVTEEEYDLNQMINTKANFLLIKALVPEMKQQQWGRIVLISSISQHGAGVNGCQYSASKGALTAMGKNLATVLLPWRITVNSISPALIGDTTMIPSPIASASTEGVPDDRGLMIAKMVSMKRLGEPKEVALVVTMFAKVGYCTGQDITIAGGLQSF